VIREELSIIEAEHLRQRRISREELLAKTAHHEDEISNDVAISSLMDESESEDHHEEKGNITEGDQDSNVERAEMAEDLEEKIRHLTQNAGEEDEEGDMGNVAPLDREMDQEFEMVSD
jgi:hypothetical protein